MVLVNFSKLLYHFGINLLLVFFIKLPKMYYFINYSPHSESFAVNLEFSLKFSYIKPIELYSIIFTSSFINFFYTFFYLISHSHCKGNFSLNPSSKISFLGFLSCIFSLSG